MKRKPRHFLFFIAFTSLCLPVAAQENLSQRVHVYHNEQVKHDIVIDSVTVKETVGPVIPERNSYIVLAHYNEEKEHFNILLLINGIETELKIPGRDDVFVPASVERKGEDIYILGYRSFVDNVGNGTNNREYAIWKNSEYLYSIIDNRYTEPHNERLLIDGEDIYIFLWACKPEVSLYEVFSFYIKNQDNAVSIGQYTDIDNEEMYTVQAYTISGSYHSTNAWSSSTTIWRLEHNGEFTFLQNVDMSKRLIVNDINVHNGTPHIVGRTMTEYYQYIPDEAKHYYYDEKHDRYTVYSATYYNGAETIEYPQYPNAERITIDNSGNVYILCSATNEEGTNCLFVLKNGLLVYSLDGSANWIRGVTEKTPYFLLDQNDVYIYAHTSNYDVEQTIYNGVLWKNGELIWTSGNRDYILDMAIQ